MSFNELLYGAPAPDVGVLANITNFLEIASPRNPTMVNLVKAGLVSSERRITRKGKKAILAYHLLYS